MKLKEFLLALVLFIVFDLIWLGIVMKDFNMRQLAEIGNIDNGAFQLNYAAASVVYILMAIAVPVFILPQLEARSSSYKVFFTGTLLGLIIYGVFDMTNLSILKNYPLAFVFPDMAWGAFVFGLVSLLTFYLAKKSK